MESAKSNGLSKDLYWQKEKPKVDDGSNRKLTQKDFFKLLTQQLSNQDPTKPVDNDQMVAQMTSFSMAEGIADLNNKFTKFATSMTSNHALQASSLIGQKVLVQGDTGYKSTEAGGLSGVIIAKKDVQELQITIETPAGEVVRTIKAGIQKAGNIEFSWDGKNKDGKAMPPGNYVVKANGNIAGKASSLPTAVHHHVDSVSLAGSKNGIVLNLDGDTSVTLDKVLQITSNKA